MAAPVIDPELRARRKNEIRDQLLAKVEELLDQGESYSALGIDRLAAEAGIGRSTFYKYFTDKSELLGAWYESIAESAEPAASEWLDGIDSDSSRDDLRAALDDIFRAYRPHVRLLSVINEAAFYDESLGEAIRHRVEPGSGRLQKHIERGQSEGWIDPELDPGETARWLRWMSDRGRQQLLLAADGVEADRLMEALTEIVWSTLYEFAPVRL
jgi:AcrR family transcriptional regulator